MARRRRSIAAPALLPRTAVLIRAATGAYLANCALGLAVQTRVLDTARHRWVHHLLYIVTSTLTGVALVIGGVRREPGALLLAPTVVPLARLPRVGHRRHWRVAVTAAPFYAAALVGSGR